MKKILTKISLFILIGIIISACDAEKRVPNDKRLLAKNEILVNDKKISDEVVFNQLYQKPNSTLLLGYKLRLNLYNLANLNPDSTYQAKFTNNPGKYERKSKWLSAKQVDRLGKSFWYHGINDFLKRTGEPPVIIDSAKTTKSLLRLKYYYFNDGFFDVETSVSLDTVMEKKATVKYLVNTKAAYLLDSIKTTISTPVLDSLYNSRKEAAMIQTGYQYKTTDFEEERNRVATHFRNNGAYYFQPTYVNFDIDTIGKRNKANVNLIINDYSFQDKDSTKTEPFKLYTISDVNIYTDYNSNKESQSIKDSVSYKNFNIYSHNNLLFAFQVVFLNNIFGNGF